MLSQSPSAGCLNQNDEVLLINLKGDTTYFHVGQYEFLRVQKVNGSTVTFTTAEIGWYGANATDNSNIGTGSGQQRVVIQRVPNYSSLTVNGTLTGNAFDGSRYGLLAFRVSGLLKGTGTISTDYLGYHGGAYESAGESYGGTSGVNGGGTPGQVNVFLNGGGGGYATNGSTLDGPGGKAYGSPDLSRIYFGSGGGGATRYYDGTNWIDGPAGANGGGAIYILAYEIGFSGQISARGQDAPIYNGNSARGGSGAGGSVRIEGATVSLDSVNVLGGMNDVRGSVGRVAVYYSGSFQASFTPGYLENPNQPTAVPTPTPVVFVPSPYGDGSEGDLNVLAGTTFNIHTQTQSTSFSCADGGDAVSYIVTALTANTATLSAAPNPGCLVPGDEVLLANLKGSAAYTNTGKFEFLHIGSVSGNTVTFLTPKVNFYGDNAADDSNLSTDQMVILQRVPNYNNVTVNGTLTGNGFDGSRFGLVVFRVKGSLEGSGIIDMDYRGYRGGGFEGAGESYGGTTGANGGGSPGQPNVFMNGGGGGYATSGYTLDGPGGKAYGSADLARIYFGSGGGGATRYYDGTNWINGPAGANGGGAIYILASSIAFTGQISARGQDAPIYDGNKARGGSGAGGSIRIQGDTISLDSVNVLGGMNDVRGSVGRVAVYYSTSFSANFNPGYLLNTTAGIVDSISSDDFEGKLLLWTVSATYPNSLATSADSAYWGKSGLEVNIADNTDVTAEDDSPAAEKTYRARFYINADKLTMGTSDKFNFFTGQTGAADSFRLQMQKPASTHQIRLVIIQDDQSTLSTSWVDLNPGWNAVEIKVQAAGLPNSNDGTATLWLNGSLMQKLTGINNDTMAIVSARLGAMGVDTGTRGPIYFDDFVSRRLSYIGTLPDPGTFPPTPTPGPGSTNNTYTYGDPAHVHAVTGVSTNGTTTSTYQYDANGNMTCRMENNQTYLQSYNAENQMSSVQAVTGTCDNPGATSATWQFIYDGDGARVEQVYTGSSTLTTYYFAGGSYEVSSDGQTTNTKVYYTFGGMSIAMSNGNPGTGTLSYFLTDHLGSMIAVLDKNGAPVSQQRYLPFGQVRSDVNNITQTDFGYTGQRNMDAQGNSVTLGLMDYNARFYDPYITHFVQPDTILPDVNNPQTLDRYSYVNNNPINNTDPTGHTSCSDIPNDQARAYCESQGGVPGFGDDSNYNGSYADDVSVYTTPVSYSGLTETQLVNKYQQDQGRTGYCASYAISTGLNMLYGTRTTGSDVVDAFDNGLIPNWPTFSWLPDGSAVLPYQQAAIVDTYSQTILGQSDHLPIAETRNLSTADTIRTLSNPNQVVLFTYNTQTGHPTSGHVVVLAAYNPSRGFGFLNSGYGRNDRTLTWMHIGEFQDYLQDPIALENSTFNPNFVVMTGP